MVAASGLPEGRPEVERVTTGAELLLPLRLAELVLRADVAEPLLVLLPVERAPVPVERLAEDLTLVLPVERLAEPELLEEDELLLMVPPTAREVEPEVLRLAEELLRCCEPEELRPTLEELLEELEELLETLEELRDALEELRDELEDTDPEERDELEDERELLCAEEPERELLPLRDWALTGAMASAVAATAESAILKIVFIMLNFKCCMVKLHISCLIISVRIQG